MFATRLLVVKLPSKLTPPIIPSIVVLPSAFIEISWALSVLKLSVSLFFTASLKSSSVLKSDKTLLFTALSIAAPTVESVLPKPKCTSPSDIKSTPSKAKILSAVIIISLVFPSSEVLTVFKVILFVFVVPSVPHTAPHSFLLSPSTRVSVSNFIDPPLLVISTSSAIVIEFIIL